MSYVSLLALGTLVAAYPLYLLHIIVPILSRGIVGGPAFQSWHLFWARPAVRYALPALCFLLLSPFFLLPSSSAIHEEDSLDTRAKAMAGEAEATTASTSFSPFRFFLGYVLCFYALRTLELLMARRKESVGEPVIFSSTLAFYAHCLLPTRVSPYQEGSTDSSKKTRRRYFIVKELLDTERAYVGNLSTFTRNYMGRLMELPAKEREKLASEQTIKEIFSNLEVILKVNEALLESLEQKMEAWTPNSILSDIFFKFTPFLKVYTTFSNNYSHGLATYIHQKKTNAKFAQWIEQTSRLPECDYYDFEDYLIMPIQRVPRYLLLFKDLVKNTPDEHEDRENLIKVLGLMTDVANFLNDSLHRADNLRKVVDIHNSLQDIPHDQTLVTPSRKYIQEQDFKQLNGKGKLVPRHVFLFNELVLIAEKTSNKPRYRVKQMLDLMLVESVHEYAERKGNGALPDIPCFEISMKDGTTKKRLVASSQQEMSSWIKAIEDQRLSAHNVMSRPARSSLRQPELENLSTYNRKNTNDKRASSMMNFLTDSLNSLSLLRDPSVSSSSASPSSLALRLERIMSISDEDHPKRVGWSRLRRAATKLIIAAVAWFKLKTLTSVFAFLSHSFVWSVMASVLLAIVHYCTFSGTFDFVLFLFSQLDLLRTSATSSSSSTNNSTTETKKEEEKAQGKEGAEKAKEKAEEQTSNNNKKEASLLRLEEIMEQPYLSNSLIEFWEDRWDPVSLSIINKLVSSFQLLPSPASSTIRSSAATATAATATSTLRREGGGGGGTRTLRRMAAMAQQQQQGRGATPSSSSASETLLWLSSAMLVIGKGLPLNLLIYGLLSQYPFLLATRRWMPSFSLFLFFLAHALLVLLFRFLQQQLLIKLEEEKGKEGGGAVMRMIQLMKMGREEENEVAVRRASYILFVVVLCVTLPLAFAPVITV